MKAVRIILFALGIIGILVGVGLIIGGGVVTWVHTEFKDSEGYYTSKTVSLTSDSHAITTKTADIKMEAAWLWQWDDLVTFKIRGINEDPSKGLFIGIASENDAYSYLQNVEYDEIEEFELRPLHVEYRNFSGTSQPASPVTQLFWDANSYGKGEQVLEWEMEEGKWVLVLMNEDGSKGVDLDGKVGVKVPGLLWIGVGLIIGGVVALGLSIFFIVIAVRQSDKSNHQPPPSEDQAAH
ncbi:MAG: hypothetical protein R6U89_08225 [Dehalococcoidia bacterium]